MSLTYSLGDSHLTCFSELNVNSAIANPSHGEAIVVNSSAVGVLGTYTLRGYAYTGGGRRINRVEVSFDNGYNWKLAKVDYPEDLYRTMTHADSTFGKFDLNERDTSL